jgi:hypothetical protein
MCGDSLLVYDDVAMIGHVGCPTELSIPNAIEELFDGCFAGQDYLSAVSFEPGSRLRRIGDSAFHNSGLRSIVIPASVQRLESCCFSGCDELSIVRFEADSQLSFIASDAFEYCASMESVWIPSSLTAIALGAFSGSPDVRIVIIETESVVFPHAGRLTICPTLV